MPENYSEMIFYAFRYCLGRMTYSVSTCSDYLIEHWEELRKTDRELILKEISEAIKEHRAGHDCDIQRWKAVLDHGNKMKE